MEPGEIGSAESSVITIGFVCSMHIVGSILSLGVADGVLEGLALGLADGTSEGLALGAGLVVGAPVGTPVFPVSGSFAIHGGFVARAS